jgi:hypothetical protein
LTFQSLEEIREQQVLLVRTELMVPTVRVLLPVERQAKHL